MWVEIKIYFSKIKQSNFILCFWKAWLRELKKKKEMNNEKMKIQYIKTFTYEA